MPQGEGLASIADASPSLNPEGGPEVSDMGGGVAALCRARPRLGPVAAPILHELGETRWGVGVRGVHSGSLTPHYWAWPLGGKSQNLFAILDTLLGEGRGPEARGDTQSTASPIQGRPPFRGERKWPLDSI